MDKLFALLADAPDGVAETALTITHGIEQDLLDSLTISGEIVAKVEEMAKPRGMHLTKYFRAGNLGIEVNSADDIDAIARSAL